MVSQAGEGAYSDTAEWWIRWNGGRRDITELPWCLAKDPSWPGDADEDDPVLCGLPENHEGAHEWEMRSDLVFTRTANGIGGLDRDRLRGVPREERPQLRIHRWEMVMAVRWPDWDHWLMIWPPEYPSYDRSPQAPEWKRHMTGADFDDPEWIDPAGQFRRDLPVITGDAREQLRRAEDSVRRAFSAPACHRPGQPSRPAPGAPGQAATRSPTASLAHPAPPHFRAGWPTAYGETPLRWWRAGMFGGAEGRSAGKRPRR